MSRAVYTSKQGLAATSPAATARSDRRRRGVIEPYADSGPTPMNHPGEELVIVTDGELVFTVDGLRYELAAGDSIHFRTLLRHSWSNPSDRPARAVWLVVRSS